MISPVSIVTILSAEEMFFTAPETVRYSPPCFRSSGTKYRMVTCGCSSSLDAISTRTVQLRDFLLVQLQARLR